MSLDDLEDFEIFAGIAEEDQIASKREAANGRADVRTRASQFAGKRRKTMALVSQQHHELLRDAAFLRGGTSIHYLEEKLAKLVKAE